VSELRSVIEGLRSESLPELPDARIEEDFAELHGAIELLEAERLRRLAEIDRRRLCERDGHLSTASWLTAAHRVAWGTARAQVRVARALERMPLTRRALGSGDVSMSAAQLLAEAQGAEPEAFAHGEALLLDAARMHTVAELRRVVTFWRDRVAHERGAEDEDRQHAARRLHASVTLGGMVRIDGDLDPANGESLLTALRAVLDTDARSGGEEGERTPAQRRADALGEICRQWLERPDRPTVAGERPHLTVTVDAGALGIGLGHGAGVGVGEGAASAGDAAPAEFDHAGPLGIHIARQIACDASVMRVVMKGRSEPLDVGRRTPVVPPAVRRAVIVRDGSCRFPGCDRPHTWCDAHHIEHWADGGATALQNLVLLCRRHHRLVHVDGFRFELVDGRPVFHRPDGTELQGRAEAGGRAPP
jgi:hypothetical protein